MAMISLVLALVKREVRYDDTERTSVFLFNADFKFFSGTAALVTNICSLRYPLHSSGAETYAGISAQTDVTKT